MYSTHADKSPENKSQAIANNLPGQLYKGKTAHKFVGNHVDNHVDSQAVAAKPQSPSAPAMQFARWDQWKEPIKHVSAGTAALALFGMAVVNALRDSGINAYIGGSLAAKMVGGVREPGDLDLEIPGDASVAEGAKELFKGWMQRPKKAWIFENNVFFITGFANVQGVIQVTYKSLVAAKKLNILDDDYEDDIETLWGQLGTAPPITTKIDFSSEALFTLTDLNPIPKEQEKIGHYSAEYLIAAYLNRLAANLKDQNPDPKNDRLQVFSMLKELIAVEQKKAEEPLKIGEIANLLDKLKTKIIKDNIKGTNTKLPQIIKIADSIWEEVLASFDKRKDQDKPPTGKDKIRVYIPPSGSETTLKLRITSDTYRAIRELSEDRGLEEEADELVKAFKQGEPYTSRKGIESALLAVIPKRAAAVEGITNYLIEEYGE